MVLNNLNVTSKNQIHPDVQFMGRKVYDRQFEIAAVKLVLEV